MSSDVVTICRKNAPPHANHFKERFEHRAAVQNTWFSIVGGVCSGESYDGDGEFARGEGEDILGPAVDGVQRTNCEWSVEARCWQTGCGDVRPSCLLSIVLCS